jgi:epidermal growth factor receptor substrate 15
VSRLTFQEYISALTNPAAALPKFDSAASAPTAQGARPATPTQAIAPQTTGPIRVPPLTPDKINEYQGLFERAGSRGGFLGGKASNIRRLGLY